MKFRSFVAHSCLGFGLAVPWAQLDALGLRDEARYQAKPKPPPKPPKRPKGGKY